MLKGCKKTMCKKYKLKAKRPFEKTFTDWCHTDDAEAIKRNIKVIEEYGWQWQLEGGDRGHESDI